MGCLGFVIAPCVALSWLDGRRCIWWTCHFKYPARRIRYLYQPGPQQQLYRYQTDAGGRAIACRERYGLWRVYLQSFVTIIPEIEFSLFVVFPCFSVFKRSAAFYVQGSDALT